MQDSFEEDPENYKTVGVAARVGDLVGLQELVWNGRAVDVFDNRGWSPIHEAASGGFPGCLEFLLRQPSVDADWQTHEKETAMLLAARQGNSQCVRALVNAQADIDLATDEGFSPLWEAIQCCNVDCIRLLVKKGADVNQRVYTGYTPLHLAAERGYASILDYLLKHGAKQDVRADHNLTPIFLAAHWGHVDCLRILLRSAKDEGNLALVNVAAADNATPLLIAAQEGHEAVVDLLLEYGADANILVTDTGAGPLQYAIYKEHARCVHSLLPATKLSMFKDNFSDMHPLVQALQWQDTTILRMLLTAGLDAFQSQLLDPDQATELSLLAEGGLPGRKASLLCHIRKSWPLEGAKLLLEHDLSPIAQDDEIPPLLVAMWRNAFPLFCLLLRYNAPPNIYHHNICGNVAMLLALRKDLDNCCLGHSINVNSNHAKTKDKHVWLEHRKRSYVWRLFVAGGEVESLFSEDIDVNNEGQGVSGLSSLLKNCVHSKDMVVATVAWLLTLACNVRLPKSVLSLLPEEDTKEIVHIADSTPTLAHACRVKLMRTIGNKGRYTPSIITSLKLPETLREYLLFSDLDPYIGTLGCMVSLPNS